MAMNGMSLPRMSACVLAAGLVLLVIGFSSCNNAVSPPESNTAPSGNPGIGPGELHNQLVKAFLAQGRRLSGPRVEEDADYLKLYVETSREVFRAQGIEFEPDIEILREHFTLNAGRRAAGLGDIFRPFASSPADNIDNLARAGKICLTDARLLKKIFAELQPRHSDAALDRNCQTPRGFLTAAERESASATVLMAEDVLVHSLLLWSEVLGADGDDLAAFEPGEEDLVAAWWKTVTKLVGTAGADALAVTAAGAVTANAPVVVFVGSLASLATYEAFDERGW